MVVPKFTKRMLTDVQQTLWDVYCGGDEMDVAAKAVGLDRKSVYNRIAEAGGIRPRRGRHVKGRCLSFAERVQIEVGIGLGRSVRGIAAGLGRHPSTVSREINGHRTARGSYSATHAHALAWVAAGRQQTGKLEMNPVLARRVEADLGLGYSPEQIAGRLRREFGDDPEMNVHHETIYRSVYLQARGALKRDVTSALRTGRTMRKPHRATKTGQGRIPGMIMIADRPDINDVDGTRIPGHWEGDLIVGTASKSAIGTVVERATGYLLLLHLPDGHTAEKVSAALTTALIDLPDSLRRSLTWDQGKELSNHQRVSIDAGIDIYFCDPRSPWQRPSNENTNGLLRQYFLIFPRLSGHLTSGYCPRNWSPHAECLSPRVS
ncbi:MAG: IS30 family transposase [Actinomycetota bacterium]|nr:IS30 family transposase [Actinomycetota bacterium]